MKDLYIVIPNWGKFQHYKDRRPVWIKAYVDLLGRDEWWELTDSERGVLFLIWLEYAACGKRLKVARVLAGGRQKSRRRALQRLNDAGFLTLSASPEVERDKEKLVSEGSKRQPPIKKRDIHTLLDDITRSLKTMPA